VAAFKRAVMDHDYRGELSLLEADARPTAAAVPSECRSAMGYWRGYAAWRYATNAANDPAFPRDAIAARLRTAVDILREALASSPNDIELRIALMGVRQMQPLFEPQGSESWREAILETRALLIQLEREAADNPRFLWLRGGLHFWAPAPLGEGPDAAVASYRMGLATFRRRAVAESSTAPDWGQPELLMSTAYVQAYRAEPDLEQAEAAARQALSLRPDWHYLRDTLLPEILRRRTAASW
jgi:hypothetical protein